MFFGDREFFAIEAELQEIHEKWTYGHLRIWVGGQPFGDVEDTSDLASSARWGRTLLAASARRRRPDLDATTASDVYELLYGRYVTRVNTPENKPMAGTWDRDPYLLDGVGESSLRDKCAVLVVGRGDGRDRVVVMSFRDARVVEVVVDAGVFDGAVSSYCAWVESLRETPSG